MSADWKPIMFFAIDAANYRNEEDSLMFHCHTRITSEGKTSYWNDGECCKKYPLVSFFFDKLNALYQNNKHNNKFVERMQILEDTLHSIYRRVKKKDEEHLFDDVPKEFSYIRDFVLAENEYSFKYDSSTAKSLFIQRYMEGIL